MAVRIIAQFPTGTLVLIMICLTQYPKSLCVLTEVRWLLKALPSFLNASFTLKTKQNLHTYTPIAPQMERDTCYNNLSNIYK